MGAYGLIDLRWLSVVGALIVMIVARCMHWRRISFSIVLMSIIGGFSALSNHAMVTLQAAGAELLRRASPILTLQRAKRELLRGGLWLLIAIPLLPLLLLVCWLVYPIYRLFVHNDDAVEVDHVYPFSVRRGR